MIRFNCTKSTSNYTYERWKWYTLTRLSTRCHIGFAGNKSTRGFIIWLQIQNSHNNLTATVLRATAIKARRQQIGKYLIQTIERRTWRYTRRIIVCTAFSEDSTPVKLRPLRHCEETTNTLIHVIFFISRAGKIRNYGYTYVRTYTKRPSRCVRGNCGQSNTLIADIACQRNSQNGKHVRRHDDVPAVIIINNCMKQDFNELSYINAARYSTQTSLYLRATSAHWLDLKSKTACEC